MTKNFENIKIVLASASPRRKEILSMMGAEFEVLVADTDESSNLRDPAELTEELARRKGGAVFELLKDRNDGVDYAVISADTVVYCEGEILGKPRDEEDAFRMISLLSGRTHKVVTGIAITVDGKTYTDHSSTDIEVAEIPESEIWKYIATKDPLDKAGAYGIQGMFSKWVRKIDGCYFGVVGLPSAKLSELYFQVFGRHIG